MERAEMNTPATDRKSFILEKYRGQGRVNA